MSMIMVSYRRADQDAARLIADYLITKYGESSVFFDVDSIPTGMNFHDRISNAISACDVVVAIIGPHWIGKLEGELATRLANPADSVRVEIEMAQKFRKPIFPILMNGITMPQRSDLPEELRFLVDYNAARIDSGQDFRYHMSKLTSAIDKISAPAAGWLLAPLRRLWMAGVGVAAAAGIAALMWSAGPSLEKQLKNGSAKIEVATKPIEAVTVAVANVPPPVPASVTARARTQGGFLFPDSDRRYLGNADLAGLSKLELRLARNEIFARHGRFFKDQTLANYFSQFSWYQPSAVEVPISPLEDTNVNTLMAAEQK
jgi:hypothetical protein